MAAPDAHALIARRPALGCFVDIPSIVSADILARAGFDFALIDLEHGPASLETALGMILAFDRAGAPSIVRPPIGEQPWIMRALDIGAAGVMIPNVASPEMAAEAVAAASYGPQGRRGVATGIVRAAGYGADRDYEAAWNARRLVIAQIESPAALEAAPEIAAVEGVDVLFFGPADFSARADYPGAAELSAALDRIVAAAAGAGKRAGSLPFPGVDAAELLRRGADFSTVASDVGLLRDGAAAALAAARPG